MPDDLEDEFEVHSIEEVLRLNRLLRDRLTVCERKKRSIGNRYKRTRFALQDAINATDCGNFRVSEERREAWISVLQGTL